MKDRILNVLMLLCVCAALLSSLITGGQRETAPVLSTAVLASPRPMASPSPIESYRARRQSARERERETLLRLSENEEADASLRARAREALAESISRDEIELAVEAALLSRGYADALCVFQAGSLNILFTQPLAEADAQWIMHLAQEISGVEIENIRLSAC